MSKRNVLLGFGLLVLMLGVAGMAGCSECFGGKSEATAAAPQQQETPANCKVDLVGARGPEGAAGPAGAQGPVGQTGSSGAVLVGPRGAEGPAGPTGVQGATGARGPAGAVVAGGPGVTGRTGPAGVRGAAGSTGAKGASAEGYAGPTGAAGPAGAQGATGQTGAQGATLVGPTGPAGRAGAAGVQGETGETGATGATIAGVAGPTGPSGGAGVQGATGSTGATGVVGAVPCWVTYRDFWFDAGKSDVRAADSSKVADIAAYLKKNPSLHVGIDGGMAPNPTEMNDHRVNAVRDALIQAGVPADSIKIGPFGDPKNRQDRKVEVLIETVP